MKAELAIKSPEAFRTISEVADELSVPQHVLRFWESKFAHVKPLKRGGGRRYYRPGDVDVLRGIKTLLYGEGYTIRGVQKVFRLRGLRYVAEVGQAGTQQVERALVSGPEAAAPIAAAAAAAAPAAAAEPSKAASREPAQLSLVEPAPLKLATVERRKLQQNLDALLKLKAEMSRALDARSERAELVSSERPDAGRPPADRSSVERSAADRSLDRSAARLAVEA